MVRVRGIEPRSQPSEGSALNPLDDTRKMVTCTGFEPVIFCLKDRGLGQLVEHVMTQKEWRSQQDSNLHSGVRSSVS